MTNEEKIKKARGIICHNCRWNECDNDSCPTLLDTVKAIELGLAEGRKEGYEQGYEACRHYAHDYYKPKWHEIKCCSQDLPSRSKDNYLHSVIVSNEYGEPIYYNYNIDEWCDMEGDVVSDSYKYWCELPTYKE